MNHNFYFDGRQIKNYLIGFASLFSEIPYKNRRGVLESVPIHYGSPSDIISHLEMNVDNDDTKNRNRIKDISVPMFSFRMTALERNPEKRRAPHDTITVDLRPLGYTTGYVAMRPAPVRFTMELICWASSDYQAFEIAEQIIPYFNSPQQVTIEPLPRCPISTTEIYLDSVEIDTEPESQKYSAMITMNFNLTGYLLTQPRIWSTNMKFEFQMLDKEYNGTGTAVNLNDTDFSVGHEIIDTGDTKPKSLPHEDKLLTIDSFIINTPELKKVYGEKLDIFNLLIQNNRVSVDRKILDSTPLPIEYKGNEMLIELPMMELIVDDMEDIDFLFTNEVLKESLKKHTLRDDLRIMDNLFSFDSNNSVDNENILKSNNESLEIYLKLLDANLVTKGFNRTDVKLSNSDILNMFGTTRIDIEGNLSRLKAYLAGVENIKIQKDSLVGSKVLEKEYEVYMFSIENIPFDEFPTEFKTSFGKDVITNKKDIIYTTGKYIDGKLSIRMMTSDPYYNGRVVLNNGNNDGEIVVTETTTTKNLDDTFDILIEIEPNTAVSISTSLDVDEPGFNPMGIVLIDTSNRPNLRDLIFSMNGKEYDLDELLFSDEIYKIFDGYEFLNDRFINLDEYVISSLIYKKIKQNSNNSSFEDIFNTDEYVGIFKKKYNVELEDVVSMYGRLRNTIESIRNKIDIIEPEINGISKDNISQGQINITPDLAQILTTDLNGKPIYDANGDGYINLEDLKILGSEVDNIDDYDPGYVIRYGVWYKRFDLSKVSEERIKRIMSDLKVLFYLTEKTDMSELKDFLILWNKGFVTTGYDIYDDDKKQQDIRALGYDILELDDKLLFMRMFVDSIKNIMVKERDYILYFVPDMNEDSKRMLYQESGLDIDKIIMGKFIDQYFNNIKDMDQRVQDMALFREILPKMLGEYTNYSYQFDIFMYDIKKTQLFIDSLEAEHQWLSQNLPDVEQIMKDKYLS